MLFRRGHYPASLRGNPYYFLGPRPFREARLRSYIIAQHRAGRPLSAILEDRYISRCGGDSICRRVLEDPRTVAALRLDLRPDTPPSAAA